MSEHDGHLPEDPQTHRTRWELWSILIIAAVVLVASFAWRSLGHHPAGRDLSQVQTARPATGASTTTTNFVAPPAAVGAQPRTP